MNLLFFATTALLPSLIFVAGADYNSDRQLTFNNLKPLPRRNESHGMRQDDIGRVSGTLDPLEELRDALDVMSAEYFEVGVGTYVKGIDWTRAVVNTFLVSGLRTLSKALHQSRQFQNASWYDVEEIENDINLYFAQNVSPVPFCSSVSSLYVRADNRRFVPSLAPLVAYHFLLPFSPKFLAFLVNIGTWAKYMTLP